MEKDDKAIKEMRMAAIVAAAYAVTNKNIANLARLIKVKVDDMHNWAKRGSKLQHRVAIKIHELSGVSLDLLAPLEILSNDLYFNKNPFVKIFELEISLIKVTSFSTAQAQVKEQATERPVILNIRNMVSSPNRRVNHLN